MTYQFATHSWFDPLIDQAKTTTLFHRKVTIVPKFKEYDRDNNGYITLEEASFILQNPPFKFPAGKVPKNFF